MKTFDQMGVQIPQILIPKNIDVKTWSVVACDQYTQDRDYWAQVQKIADSKPSTLNIILPEVYLNDNDKSDRIKNIGLKMKQYLDDGVFEQPKNGFVYVERKTAYGRTRKGLVVSIDLETYEWKPFSKALIRATEATIVDRIPPRMEIRRGASLELPHIMLLVNDPLHSLVEKAGGFAKESGKVPLYCGDLMMESGSISGWLLESEAEVEGVRKAMEKLFEANTAADGSTFLFAVGDGNHSLATAKAVWDETKEKLKAEGLSDEEIAKSPVRYALVEIVNIYDEGLTFEPIHRVVFGIDGENLVSAVESKLEGKVRFVASFEELEKSVHESKTDFGFVFKKNGKDTFVLLETKITDLAVAMFQPVLDEVVKNDCNASIDYIHGSAEVRRLGSMDNAVSVLLPPVAKDSFFATINGRGPLPRKSFSMGEADEKRFYLECRRLFN